jgi:nondiscriminating glutamyl-tRNA synthetase
MADNSVRVRIAPSPSGDVHVGNARTALFNWLFARKQGGKFILRIEDTDSSRSTQESIHAIEESFRWLGLDWDEGPSVGGPHAPYYQSQRTPTYQMTGQALLASGRAYWCYSTPDELEQESALFQKTRRKVSHPDRHLTAEQRQAKEAEGRKPSLRFAVPEGSGEVVFQDLVRGEIRFPLAEITDFNLLRSDGRPMYDFAVVNDDHAMEISHVLRGEDGISNTPRQVLLYQALGWQLPLFGHVSFILGPDHTKLSKSHGSTSIGDFRRQGYLPQALLNYLGLLGLGGRAEGSEVMSVKELMDLFSFENLVKSPAVFDYGKLNFLNAHYLRALPDSELLERSRPFLEAAGLRSDELVLPALASVKGNVQLLSDLPGAVGFLLGKMPPLLPETFRGLSKAVLALEGFEAALRDAGGPKDAEAARALLKAAQARCGVKGKDFFMPLRLALSGMEHGPELVQWLPLCPAELWRERIHAALPLLELI